MTLTVLFFAEARDRIGHARRALELPDGSRVADALAALRAAHPELEPLVPHLAVAVNGELATATTPIPSGAELALLPPVSGG
jgi:molybdopterin synthase catalytic subunit